MPIFEQLRAQGDLPCTYPLHMASHGTAFIRGGSRSTPLSPHAPHCHPSTHWVSFAGLFSFIEAALDMVRRRSEKVLLIPLPFRFHSFFLRLLYIIYDFDICLLWVEKNIDNNSLPLSLSLSPRLRFMFQFLSSRLAI